MQQSNIKQNIKEGKNQELKWHCYKLINHLKEELSFNYLSGEIVIVINVEKVGNRNKMKLLKRKIQK